MREKENNEKKKAIIEMIEEIQSQDLLDMIIGFVYGGYKIEKERRQGN